MKTALSLSTITIICLVIWIIFAQECRRSPDQPTPEGYTLISQVAIDSINLLANQPGDTVYIDTTEDRVIIKWLDAPIPEPVLLDSGIRFYADTVTSDSVSIWVELWIKGELQHWSLGGEVLKTTIDRIIEVPRPVIVTNTIEVPTLERGLFIGFKTGGSPTGGLLFGLD